MTKYWAYEAAQKLKSKVFGTPKVTTHIFLYKQWYITMQPMLKIQQNFHTPKKSYKISRWFQQFSQPSGGEA